LNLLVKFVFDYWSFEMKSLIALLATTSISLAASVGVSNDQLKASGQPVPGDWTLTGTMNYDDGTEEGVEIVLPLAAYPNKQQCEEVASDPDNIRLAAAHNHMKLDCRQ
jgi:hypothetical protein